MTPSDYTHHFMPSMEGWCSAEKASAIITLIQRHRPSIFLEIGVFAGRSLFAAALAMEELNHGHCIGIDPWREAASVEGFTDENRAWWSKLDHEAIYRQCLVTRKTLGLTDRVTLRRETAATAMDAICEFALRTVIPRPIDMLHIDGNHSAASALFDVENYVPLVPTGGIILFDDLDWETTRPAQEALSRLARLDAQVGTCGIYTRSLDLDEPSTPPAP